MSDVTALPPEEWRPVPGYERTYEVSSLGRVKSLPRRGTRGGVLKASPTHDGYLQLTLVQDGARRQWKIHHLVVAAFLGPRPDGHQIRHLDGNGRNNSASNLRYGTGSENILDEVAHGTHSQARKTHCPQGHEYTPENTYYRPGHPTNRYCRACNRYWQGVRRLNAKRVGVA